MLNYGKVFAAALHERLKEQIVAHIYVTYDENDQIYINIKSYDDVDYRMRITELSEKVVRGYSSEYACYEIVKDFRKYINEKFVTRYFC